MEREELRAAEAHIARLEEELLRLKDVKRELQSLREQHQQLRRSAEGRIVKMLSSPFRLWRRAKPAGPMRSDYERWFARHRVSSNELGRLRAEADAFAYQPLVSILVPTFNSNDDHLRDAAESALAQVYPKWELIIVDDGSPAPARVLSELTDSRVRVFPEKQHAGISAALNVALGHARGDWIALLDHDDLLEPDALFRAVEWLQSDRSADVIYSDEDKIVDEHFAAPMLKPDWSPELFLTHDYLGHFVVIRRDFVDKFGTEFDGAQDYDLLLRVSEKTDRIRHISRVLYHWRRTQESTAHNIRRKPGALEAGRRAIEEHLQRANEPARVTVDWETHLYRVRRKILPPRISIVLSGADTETAATIRERTAYPCDIITNPSALPDNRSDWLLFLDATLEPVREDWLSILAEYVHAHVGAVGPRIVAADGTIESAGIILLPGGQVRAAFAGMPRDFRGANRQLQVVRNYSAVSAGCLLTRRDLFEKFGNAAEVPDFAQSGKLCAAVEFCLKLHDAGLRILSVPYAELRRTSATSNATESCPHLTERWPEVFARDPFYNPNLSRERADFSLDDRQHE